MFVISGILNIIAAIVLAYWSFGTLNNVLLLIPSWVFCTIGCLSLGKAIREKK